jgi:spermidine/putrescine transport system ATP-binding protein
MQEQTRVKLDNVVKRYGSLTAVNGISLEVKDGEFFSLLGPSGCGKTTTLRSIAGFEQPTSGRVYIDGVDQTDTLPNERDTGMVFQGFALFPHKTVGQNVGFGLKMQGVPKEERKDRVAEILELVDLPGTEDRSPEELSGGQQQRIALARALVIEPSVLLLDEPLASLDLKLREQMRYELKRIQTELDITTVYVTHDQEEALSMSDRIAVMNDGEIAQIGSPDKIYHDPKDEFVANFIGETNLLPGSVESRQNGHLKIDVADIDHTLQVDKSAIQTEVSQNSDVMMSLRPENVSIAARGESQSENSFTGTVQTKTFLGKTTQFVLDVNGSEVTVESGTTSVNQEYEKGDEMAIAWEPDECLVMTK